MGLSWQQGPLSSGRIGKFLVPGPLPERLLYAEPLRRRMRVRFGGAWIADSEDVVLLHEPGHYPVAYFPLGDITAGALEAGGDTPRHPAGWVRRLGRARGRGVEPNRGRPGSTPGGPTMPTGSGAGRCSGGGPWMPSTKKRSGSSPTPPTPTTASTSATPAATSSCGAKI